MNDDGKFNHENILEEKLHGLSIWGFIQWV